MIVVVWFLTKKKQAAPTGSLAAAVSGVASGIETTISDLSLGWAAIRGDLGFNA